jgi:1,4-alpha-glucan branching enzyme
MGWMHDTLYYLEQDPVYRKFYHNQMTFRGFYAMSENFILALSHDEVVHGKRSLLSKMPGSDAQKFANLRLLFGYMYAQPGKKLLFMGDEFGQREEWDHDSSLDWHLTALSPHQGLQKWVIDLNKIYRAEKALFYADYSSNGFQWVNADDIENSVFSFVRKSAEGDQIILAVFNCTPVTRFNFRLGVPQAGLWREILNSDAIEYGGQGLGNLGQSATEDHPFNNFLNSINITLPPLSALFFQNPISNTRLPLE